MSKRRHITRYAAGRRLAAHELRVYAGIHTALARTLDHSRRTVLGGGSLVAAINPDLLNSARPVWTRELSLHGEPVLVTLYDTTFNNAAKGATEQLADVRNRLSEAYWADRLRVLSTSIDAIYDQIRTEISRGIADGEDSDQLTARIARVMHIDAANDAGQPRYAGDLARIARTETALAYNKASFDAALAQREAGGPDFTKEWIATLDERTRDSHDAADGQVVGLVEPFTVGAALLQFPSDPEGPPEETINCRCTVGFEETGSIAAATNPHITGDYAGGMVALRPADPDSLAVEGGDPPADLHVTLTFLGDDVTELDEGVLDDILDAAETVAATMGPFDVRVAGHGQLGDHGAQVLLLNGGGIDDARNAFTDNVGSHMLPEQHAPFIPHLTLGYGMEVPAMPEIGTEVRMNALTVNLAGEEFRFPLSGLTDGEMDGMGDSVTAAVSAIPEQLGDYWTHGPGAAKIRWGTHGSFDRCRRNLRKYVPEGHTLDGLCANLHNMATGKYPGQGHAASGQEEPVSTEVLIASLAGSASLPVADRDHAWNGDDATGRIIAHCTRGDSVDVGCVAQGHLWRHSEKDPSTLAAWSLPFADVINGKLAIVPQGIASVAGGHGLRRLGGASSADLAAMKRRVCSIYATVRKRYSDWPECPFTRGANPTHDTRSEENMTAAMLTDYPVSPPLMPPAEWFTDPRLDGPTPITVTNEGRVFGHLGPDGLCHTGFGDRCEMIPRSATNYAYFRTGEIVTADGARVPVGQITAGGGHADLRLGWVAAKGHYDDVSTAVADVAAGEDAHGVWLAGALRPDVTPAQIRILMGSRPSGDWRPIGGARELIGAHSVNVPGYPVRRAVVASAEEPPNSPIVIIGEPVQYLVASGCGNCDSEDATRAAATVDAVSRRIVAARIRTAAARL